MGTSFRRIDLHLHTDRSDGRFRPEEVLERCARRGLDLIALTDHDLPSTTPVGVTAIEGRTPVVLSGAELSAMHGGSELHLLVYFSCAPPQTFVEFCRSLRRSRIERFRIALEMLGCPLSLAETAEALDTALTRHHLARAVVQAGKAKTLREAFDRFVGDRASIVPPVPLAFLDAVRTARACGGLTSWAHPSKQAVECHLDELVRAGLQGLEGVRPVLSSRDRRFFRRCAERHGLFVTAGSDWHGWEDPELGLFAAQASDVRDFLDALQVSGSFVGATGSAP